MTDHDRALEKAALNPIELLFRSIENLRKYRPQGGRGKQVAYAAHVDAVQMNARDALAAVMEAAKHVAVMEYLDSLLEGLPAHLYPWLTIHEDGSWEADMEGTTPAEMDRRLIIMQELSAFLRSLRTGLEGEGDG